MKLLVIGSGMMGSAAAYDMARQGQVDSVTLADSDLKRAKDVAARVNRITNDKKVRAVALDAAKEKDAARLMKGHDGALSAVPYFLNLGLAKAAITAGCHFADLGGNSRSPNKPRNAASASLPIAAYLPAWPPSSAANWFVASTDAPTPSNSMWVASPKGRCLRFTIS
jgi:saccharopine dehydrogenase-like NADP-dependent oxidoreductase